MLKDLFHKKNSQDKGYAVINVQKERTDQELDYAGKYRFEKKKVEEEPQEGLLTCKGCSAKISEDEVAANKWVCPECSHHFRMRARDRINIIADSGSFTEYDTDIKTVNPLQFKGYDEKLDQAKEKSALEEAVVTGEASIKGSPLVICVMDSAFMMGSMGSVVGEKISRAIEKAIERRLPVVIFSTSGGARMQEGMLSLMQMAKTSAVLAKLDEAGLLYISVFTDPTTGGVTASFAMLGDIIIAEPKALIGFAGPRVIEQTIRQKLPEGFQRAEFLVEKGFVDMIVHRHEMREKLSDLIKIHSMGGDMNE